MRNLKIALATLVVSGLTVIVIFAGAVYSGAYNVAANDKHWSITYWTLHKAVQNSVAARADDIKSPLLGDPSQLALGAVYFNENCSGCHTPPGARQSEAAKGMYPTPPDLSVSGKEMPANRIFWTIKNGIKASGMPAWGVTHGDKAIWAMTALIKRFPDMSGADYQRLLRTGKARGIGHELSDQGSGPHRSDSEEQEQDHAETPHDHAQAPHAHG